MDDSNLTCALISDRFANNHVAIRSLNELQKKTINDFISDSRINYVSVDRCMICGHDDFIKVAEKDQFGIPLDTVLCKQCGLIFTVNQLDSASTMIFYSEYYRKIYEGVIGPSLDHGYYRRLFSVQYSVPSIPKFVSSSSVVLEIGCGGGWNLVPYHNVGISYFGFDYDVDMIAFGRKKYGLNIYEGDIETARDHGVKADFVILSHVLEHAINPLSFLAELASVMKDGALVRITVPCIDCLRYFGGSGTSYDFGLVLQNAHNFTFSERTLTFVLIEAGFMPIVSIRGFCLAKYVGPGNLSLKQPKNNPDYWRDVISLLRSSEKYRTLKASILSISPSIIKTMLGYVHYFFRPFTLLKYFLILKTKHIGSLLLK